MTLCYGVDVVDTQESEGAVVIVPLVFESTSFNSVGNRRNVWSRVENCNFLARRIGEANLSNHFLVALANSVLKATQSLRTSPDRTAVW
jgi:hypothetical protein